MTSLSTHSFQCDGFSPCSTCIPRYALCTRGFAWRLEDIVPLEDIGGADTAGGGGMPEYDAPSPKFTLEDPTCPVVTRDVQVKWLDLLSKSN